MKICFDTKKITNLNKWWFGIWRLESVPALGFGIMDIIAILAIVTNKNKFFSEKSKKNPHWGDFYKIMTIFS